jgi:hypothetical protein
VNRTVKLSKYFPEFLEYYKMAITQQQECNTGTTPHHLGTVKDDLMVNVHLYDVAERKLAGFGQILLDAWYGNTPEHPYAHKLHDVRKPIATNFTGATAKWGMREWLYLFMVHRLTGSGINYAQNPSGYHNTVIPQFYQADSVEDMVEIIKGAGSQKIFTSVGYQIAAFPKPPSESRYRRGGDYFMCEMVPRLIDDIVFFLSTPGVKSLRELGEYMFTWNQIHGIRVFRFQYAAFIADVADYYPNLVDPYSMFYYGTNAVECMSYLAEPVKRMQKEDFLDRVTEEVMFEMPGTKPYDIEDVACDFIRWTENYLNPKDHYANLCRDSIWNSSRIVDHPYGRQKMMLELKLIDSFNSINQHPSDDFVISRAGISASQYKDMVEMIYG